MFFWRTNECHALKFRNYASVHQIQVYIVNDKLKSLHTCLHMHVALVPRTPSFFVALPLPCNILNVKRRTKMEEAWERGYHAGPPMITSFRETKLTMCLYSFFLWATCCVRWSMQSMKRWRHGLLPVLMASTAPPACQMSNAKLQRFSR